MTVRTRSSPPQPSDSLPESPIVADTAKALGKFFTAAVEELETRMKAVLQPTDAANPLNRLVLKLTQDMIADLSQSVSRALGAAAPPAPGVSTEDTPAARPAVRQPRPKPAPRRRRR
jgi:hypothetical protein